MEPLLRTSKFTGEVVGFDTEYTSKGQKLISFQLAYGEKTSFVRTARLSVSLLARTLRTLGVPEGSEVMLVSFFSLAELQFLPVKSEAYSWREYGSGSLDCSFYSERYSLTLHVFDLARFFDKQSLAKVAESLGLKKLEWNRKQVTKADSFKKGFREYAINDAILCGQILSALRIQFAHYGVDPLREKTAASVAAAVFRRHWVDKQIESGNNRARLSGMRACWGGRAEAIQRGRFEKVIEWDLKSAYPNAAISLGIMPIQKSWIECPTLAKFLRMSGGFAKISFSFPRGTIYPSLPQILPDAQLYALSGLEWVTLDEIRFAIIQGAKIKLLEAWGYTKGTTILRDYMQEITEKRKTAVGAQKVALKLLANSLIGKFAQRVSDINVDELRKLANRQRIRVDDLGKMTRDELVALGLNPSIRVGSVFMPEWNSLITGRVRAIISQAAEETNAVYIATDAVWATTNKKPSHADFEKKREGPAVVARTRFGMILDDAENPHIAHHSVWNRKAGIESLRDLSVDRKRYKIRRPIKLRESITKGVPVGVWEESTRIAWNGWDQKRRLLTNGTTLPWKDAKEYQNAISESKREEKAKQKNARSNPRSIGEIENG